MLVNPTSAQTQSEVCNVQTAVDKLGQRVRIFNVTTDRELDAATTGRGSCSARAASGHVAAAPPRSVMRAAQRSLAVMCPACWCNPGGLLALMGCANRVLIIRTGSMSR